MNRREFLELMVGMGAGAAASAVGLRGSWLHELDAPRAFAPRAPGAERLVATTCGLCPGGCGMLARVVDGRAVSVRGNPLHPVNRGGLCPKGLAAIQSLRDPDRPRRPLLRAGRSKPLIPVSWDDAIATLAGRLRSLREAGEPHALALVLDTGRGLAPRLFRRFAEAYGTPNVLTASSPYEEPVRLATRMTQGLERALVPDLDDSAYVLSFGTALLEGSGSPGSQMRAFGAFRDARRRRRGKLVQVEPRLSITAAKADEWVRIRPGAEGTLALGLAYVLIREEAYDRAFVAEHVAGFEEFRTLVLRSYHLDSVSQETGVPVATIARLAKELGRTRPAIAIGEGGTRNGTVSLLAVYSLNALLGSIDVPGGLLLPPDAPELALERPGLDAVAEAGLARPRLDGAGGSRYRLASSILDELPAAIESRKPYAVQAAIIRGADPLHDCAAPERFRRALGRVPFVAAIGPVLDETAAAADLFLPEPHFLESLDLEPAPACGRFAAVSIRQPVEGEGSLLPAGETLLRLARAVGGPVGAALPWKDWRELIDAEADTVFRARRGAIFEAGGKGSWTERLAERGWWAPSYASARELFDQIGEKGGWWDPGYDFRSWARVLRTASGRFELPWQQLSVAEPAQFEGDESRYPLVLAPYRVLALGGAAAARLPLLQEIAGVHFRERWGSWIELHPDTAARAGVSDREMVTIETPHGELKARARIYAGASPDLAALPIGQGYGRGVNPLDVVGVAIDPIAGTAAPVSTRARIVRA